MSHLMSLSGVKGTCRFALHMSAFDPKWTSRGHVPCPPMTLERHARLPQTSYNLWRAGCELILMPVLKARGKWRSCDARDCGLAQTAWSRATHSALRRERD